MNEYTQSAAKRVNLGKVGVYRTAYPLYSETFISEQIRSYAGFTPLVLCRDLLRDPRGVDVVQIGQGSRISRARFTILGSARCNRDLSELSLVHAHFAPDAALVLPMANALGVPLVVTCHGSDIMVDDFSRLKSGRITELRFMLCRAKLKREAAMFIAVSKFLRNAMVERGYPADKVVTHYIGVDTKKFCPGASGSGVLHPYILNVARHTDVKGIDNLLHAFRAVSLMYPEVRLIQIGAGTLTAELKALAIQLGLAERVTFLGPKSSSEVVAFMQSAQAVVLTSRKSKSGAEEALGLALIEAAACGVPCIGTNTGGIPEAIAHGETGFLVPPDDAEALAGAINWILANGVQAKQMGRRGREMVQFMFDLKKQTTGLEGLYADVLARV